MAVFMHDSAVENWVPHPGSLICGRYKRGFGYRVKRSKGTKDFYLTLTLSGQGWFHNGEETLRTGAGDLSIIVPGTPYYYATAENSSWEFFWCHFIPREEWIGLLRLPEPVKGIKCVSVENPVIRTRLSVAFARLVKYHKEPGPYAEKLAANALEEVLILASQTYADKPQAIDPPASKASST